MDDGADVAWAPNGMICNYVAERPTVRFAASAPPPSSSSSVSLSGSKRTQSADARRTTQRCTDWMVRSNRSVPCCAVLCNRLAPASLVRRRHICSTSLQMTHTHTHTHRHMGTARRFDHGLTRSSINQGRPPTALARDSKCVALATLSTLPRAALRCVRPIEKRFGSPRGGSGGHVCVRARWPISCLC